MSPSWLERLDAADRACLDRQIGYAPPAFPRDSEWAGGEPQSWDALRGKVVVLQSWTCRTGAGRSSPERTAKALSGFGDEVVLIAVHTPRGSEKAAAFLARRSFGVPVMIDSGGYFCDALGLYDRPVNVVVDRNGTVRYAGLNSKGLALAVEALVAEPHDPQVRPEPLAAPGPAPEFPPFAGSVGPADDVRGRTAPELFVQQWITDRPDPAGKVVVIDFWALWCGPCRGSIPHMNQLAERFREDVVCIGISSEAPATFQQNLQKYKLSLEQFQYALALDPTRRMSRPIRVRGIPHVIVLSSDWVVRWQGHPMGLTEEILGQIVEANEAAGGHIPRCQRWTAQRKS